MDNWERVVEILNMELGDIRLLAECTCHNMVLITKGGGECRGIGLVEVLWKDLLVLIN